MSAEGGVAGEVDEFAQCLADESFRHSWNMSDERRIDGVWVAGLCCDCGEFVPYGREVAHVAAALAPLIRKVQANAWDDALGSCNDYSGDAPNPFTTPTATDDGAHGEGL